MKWQHLKVVYVFHCFHQQDELIHQLHSARKNHPASMSFLNVASFNGSKFEASLQSVHVGVGLMADLNCGGLAGVLKALSLSFLQIGAWSTSAGLTMWDKRSVYERRQNLLGMQLTGIAKATIGASTVNGELQSGRAYGLRLWNALSTMHNLSITENLVNEGNQQPFDLIINPVEIKQQDISKLHYTAAVHDTQTILLFLHPNVDWTRNLFLRPFTVLSWLGITALFLAFLLLMCCILHLDRLEGQDRENGILVLVLGILCQQGFIETFHSYASRITVFAMILFSMLVYQFYLTYIVSFLLVVPPKSIHTLHQLVENGFAVALENVPKNVEYLNATDDEHLLALVQKQLTQADTLYYDMAEGLELILRGRVAFLCDAHRAYQMMQTHFTDEQRCALQEVVLISKKSTHLALAKDNPLRELFRITVHRIAGNGVMQYERSRCYADKPRCAENEVKMPEVNLDQVSSVMVLLLGAIVGSIAVLLLELTVSRVWPGRAQSRAEQRNEPETLTPAPHSKHQSFFGWQKWLHSLCYLTCTQKKAADRF
uniref:Ionotropic glutamate receptor C-terminal domain-containing protein n=1 Tax=Anopheles quadriannulatus TaxID=34691 RepID=A0A182X2Q2_ANOQN